MSRSRKGYKVQSHIKCCYNCKNSEETKIGLMCKLVWQDERLEDIDGQDAGVDYLGVCKEWEEKENPYARN